MKKIKCTGSKVSLFSHKQGGLDIYVFDQTNVWQHNEKNDDNVTLDNDQFFVIVESAKHKGYFKFVIKMEQLPDFIGDITEILE